MNFNTAMAACDALPQKQSMVVLLNKKTTDENHGTIVELQKTLVSN